jgi:hypothetical protein
MSGQGRPQVPAKPVPPPKPGSTAGGDRPEAPARKPGNNLLEADYILINEIPTILAPMIDFKYTHLILFDAQASRLRVVLPCLAWEDLRYDDLIFPLYCLPVENTNCADRVHAQ